MCYHLYGAAWLQTYTYHPETVHYRRNDNYLEKIGHPKNVITNDQLLKECDEINFGAKDCYYDTYWPQLPNIETDLDKLMFFDYGLATECEVQFGENKGHVYPATQGFRQGSQCQHMDCFNSMTNEFEACKAFYNFWGLFINTSFPLNLQEAYERCMDAISVQPVCKYCANPQYDQSFKVTKFFTSGERYDPVGIWRNPDLTTQENNCVEDCSILGLGFTNPSSFDISSLNTCGRQDGFFLNSSNKCESCTVFDAKCSKCSTTECTEC